MSDTPQADAAFFLGIMVMKDGKWTPHTKFDDGAFGTALIRAEELDKSPEFDGVKVLRVPKSGNGEQKEMWVSSKAAARAEAAKANMVTAGAKKSKEQLAAAARQAAQKKT